MIRAALVGVAIAAATLTAPFATAASSLIPHVSEGAFVTSPAECCDGNDAYAEHSSGACSSHGGVCQWFGTLWNPSPGYDASIRTLRE
jgi:hypothetical protein